MCSNEDFKFLPKSFVGVGEVRGFQFDQIRSNEKAFIYQVRDPWGGIYYEVFARHVNTRFNCESYPNSPSFGVWASSAQSILDAQSKFDELSKIN